MALANWSEGIEIKEGNLVPTTQFYELDLRTVMNQPGAVWIGLLHFQFRGIDTTVYAAKDGAGAVLPLVALPCPPWYHEDFLEAYPTNIISAETK